MDADKCVICNAIVPEGTHVCGRCKYEIDRPPKTDMPCDICPHEDMDVCRRCLKYGGG